MGQCNDSSKFEKMLAEERAIYPDTTQAWKSARELHLAMGEVPPGHYLGKRDQFLPHGLENSVWKLTPQGKAAQRRQVMRDLQSRHMPKPHA